MPCMKVAFANAKEARARLKEIRKEEKRNQTPMRAYQCPICGMWHLTAMSKKKFVAVEKGLENNRHRSIIREIMRKKGWDKKVNEQIKKRLRDLEDNN